MTRDREQRWLHVYGRTIAIHGIDSMRAVRIIAWATRNHPNLASLMRLMRFMFGELRAG